MKPLPKRERSKDRHPVTRVQLVLLDSIGLRAAYWAGRMYERRIIRERRRNQQMMSDKPPYGGY